MSERTLAWLAEAGVIGLVVFGFTIIVLAFLEYDLMVGLGWNPIQNSDVPWPSALAPGPYGWLHVANFVFFGGCLIALAFGLHGGARAGGRGSWLVPHYIRETLGPTGTYAAFETNNSSWR